MEAEGRLTEIVLTLIRLLTGLVGEATAGLAVAGWCTLAWGAGRDVYRDLRSLVASFFVFWNRDFGWLDVPPGESVSVAKPG